MAKSLKDITSEEDLDKISVTLRPVFGIQPVVYVPALWGTAILLLLFAVFLLPGLRSYGTVLTVESSPAGAQVFVDGVLRGSTPLETFVDAGDRRLEIRLAGFAAHRIDKTVSGRRVGSRPFPLRDTMRVVFSEPDMTAIRAAAIEDFSAWSLGAEPGAQFQHPPAAGDGARRLWAAGLDTPRGPDGSGTDQGNAYIHDLVAHAEPYQSHDVSGAAIRVSNPGGVVHSGSIARLVQKFVQLDNDYQGFHRVATELSGAEMDRLSDSAWYRVREDRLSTELLAASVELDEGRAPIAQQRLVDGLRFVAVPAGRYAIGYPLRDENTTGVIVEHPEDFWIQAEEMSRRDFARFLLDHPEWAPENRDRDDYLRDWPSDWLKWTEGVSSDGANLPVRFVGRDAAEAYARWFTADSGLSDEVARLPSAAEWEYAAFLNDPGERDVANGRLLASDDIPRGALGAHAMSGNLWEWTGDWYGRAGHVVPPEFGAMATVMGGSYANTFPVHNMRGAQPPEQTSPFLGFRLVIVPERGN